MPPRSRAEWSGGTTLYFNEASSQIDMPAIDAVMATWSKTSLSYTTRVAMLTPTLTAATFDDAGAADALTGGAGLDWFIKSLPDVLKDRITLTDPVTGKAVKEKVLIVWKGELFGCSPQPMCWRASRPKFEFRRFFVAVKYCWKTSCEN